MVSGSASHDYQEEEDEEEGEEEEQEQGRLLPSMHCSTGEHSVPPAGMLS